MIEVGVILVIIVAVWFYLRTKKQGIDSSVEADKKSEFVQEAATEIKKETASKPVEVGSKSVSASAKVSDPVAVIPEDSTLRRHYLHNLAAKKASLETPFPEDSALRRHYLQNLAAQTGSSSSNDTQAVAIEATVPENIAVVKTSTPDEAEVKRDLIQQLVAETEATMPPRPTDSTLKRHYDTQLMSSVLSQLEALK